MDVAVMQQYKLPTMQELMNNATTVMQATRIPARLPVSMRVAATPIFKQVNSVTMETQVI
ncbi:MAG: hypothetical protein A3F82_10225 [Deltaproteobacteria bacterium RIFCSPLOWO2_12_FULL_44_12]|nr:MAG: hypothetical protein A2712_00105 [Deltaproteobacteria bacterium RIFCSPHIGHO2_01_FULL_43_49]OGQ15822.1 MAG: hypothetical protein A3D22_02755 [Deltaproteobacteria bacterium RIFCSPHIGHO2_02_FULL_44_53]OGQ28776.1 MAG: hypothetical protein A3D98_01085 [Deltaproteobacteria bacterium RIFCSPHIGHO2_12_FULL_44_21]OGQ32096.1 MAG: hypothetical protein A2979_03210 [Deltaproteobacteria bacterium RIFCSPLOWO2_01_FULL_45_74]OGQ43761.1 MAG: hypothetical protein A3I70_05780 [Deltaproteobacteria bacterium 